MKKCSKCKKYKNMDNFSKDKRASDGHSCECKKCHNQATKKYPLIYKQNNTLEVLNDKKHKIKTCSKCKQNKKRLNFSISRCSIDGYKSLCKICDNKNRKPYTKEQLAKKNQWKKNNKNKVRNQHYKLNFGITYEDYNKILMKQNYTCAICKQPEVAKNSNGKIKLLAVDHNHETGKIRGLLCWQCNKNLWALDNKVFFNNAIKYLEKHS